MCAFACKNADTHKKIRGDEFDRVGTFTDDSIPRGSIKYYTTGSDELVAIREFKEGVLNGPSINYHDGRIIQTLNFKNGLENGFANVYDTSKGFLKQQEFYFNGRQLGPSIQYDSLNSILSYEFRNFENHELFSFYLDSRNNYVHDNYDKMISVNFNRVTKNNEKKLRLFTYLIYPPKTSVQYKIGYYNEKEQQVDSVILPKSDDVFWEGFVDHPAPNKKPALVISIYDSLELKSHVFFNYLALKDDD
jgi:antitoxin component YwqK of YwqJK toxin-antitoxin module